MDKDKINLTRQRHVGITAVTPFCLESSASRLTMQNAMVSQSPILKELDSKSITTGIEFDLADDIIDVKAPCDLRIEFIVKKHMASNGSSLKMERFVIYSNIDTGEYGVFKVPTFLKNNTVFSYELVPGPAFDKLTEGAILKKGEVVATSRTVKLGEHRLGRQANVVLLSEPAVAEDCILVNEDWAKHVEYNTNITVEDTLKDGYYLVNLYGTDKIYKPVPMPGDKVREDGIILAKRRYNKETAPIALDILNSREVFITDSIKRINTDGDQFIEDVEVIHPNRELKPGNSGDYLKHLINHHIGFHDRMANIYEKIQQRAGYKGAVYEPALINEFINSLMLCSNKVYGQRIPLVSKQRKITNTVIRVEVRSTRRLSEGGKLTTEYASKGVSKITPASKMPRTKDGIVADLVLDSRTLSDRLILGLGYAHYFYDVISRATRYIREGIDYDKDHESYEDTINIVKRLKDKEPAKYKHLSNHVLNLHKVISPDVYVTLNRSIDTKSYIEYLARSLKYGIQTVMSIDSQSKFTAHERLKACAKTSYHAKREHILVYNHYKKEYEETIQRIRLAPLYIYALSKDGKEVSATNSVHLNVTGISGVSSYNAKYSTPIPAKNSTLISHMEASILSSVVKPETFAELMDINSNSNSLEESIRHIFRADKPTAIKNLIDRKKIPYGSRPLEMFNHMLALINSEMYDDTKP